MNLYLVYLLDKDSSHGRTEQRKYHVLNNIRELVDSTKKWSNFNSAIKVEYSRQLKSGKIKQESRYFITSLSQNAEQLAEYIRGHSLHRKSITLGLGCRF